MKERLLLILIIALLAVSFIAAQESCEITAKNTDALLAEIPGLNAKLDSCDASMPSPFDRLFGNDVINVQIVRNNGSKSNILVVTEDKIVKSVEIGYSEKPTYVATLAECALDNVLKSSNQAGALAYLYSKKHLTIGPHGIWRSIVFRFAMFFGRGRIASASQEIETTCPKKAVGEVCNHGGECETGNCIGIVPGQLYKCSCDPYRYVDADTEGDCPK